MTTASRHLTPERLAEYLASGVLATVPVDGSPTTRLVIDPVGQELALEVRWNGESVAPLTEYAHLEASVIVRDRADWARLTITDADHLLDAFPVLCAVADRIQIDG